MTLRLDSEERPGTDLRTSELTDPGPPDAQTSAPELIDAELDAPALLGHELIGGAQEDPGPAVLPDDWQPPTVSLSVVRVTAVLVAHDGEAFLPRTLDAVEAQTRPPDLLVAVDAGSRDHSGDLLELATDHMLKLERDTSFGDAVQAALAVRDGLSMYPRPEPRPDPRPDPTPEASTPEPGTSQPVPDDLAEPQLVEWLWLLHDDSAPAPDCLQRLLDTVDAGPSIGIAGCKQVSWDDARRLLDVGFTTSRLGARVTGVDVDDVDQGQLDHRSDVMAVSTAGMLLRRDLWQRLGGPDPALTHTRGDLDLCRRAHLSGARVVVVPDAVVAHAAASATGRRPEAPADNWARNDRRAALHLRLAAAPRPLLPFLLIWLGLAALARGTARLALKQPERAAGEVFAYAAAVSRPLAWLRPRRGPRLPRREFRRLLAGPREIGRQRREELTAYLRRQDQLPAPPATPAAATPATVTPAVTSSAGAPVAVPDVTGPDVVLDEGLDVDLADDDEAALLRPRRVGPSPVRVLGAIAVLCLLSSLAGLRGLLVGAGSAIGPALLPLPEKASQLWDLAWSGWRPVGLGMPGTGDPLDALLALPAWLLGSGPAAVRLLLLVALPLAAGLAWWAAGSLTASRSLRAWAAIGWAAQPTLLAALASGRLGAVLAHLLLPPTGLALARAVGAGRPARYRPTAERARPARRPGSISAASASALLLTALVAAAPALAVPAVIGLAAALLLALPRTRLRLLWVLAVPGVLLLPWWTAVLHAPRLLLAEPGGASATGPVQPWPALLWPGDPIGMTAGPARRLAEIVANAIGAGTGTELLQGLAAAVAVPVLGLALLALFRPGRRGTVAAVGWLLALAGLAVALGVQLVDVRVGGGQALHGWPGPGTSLVAFGLLIAALSGLDGAADRLRARNVGWRHPSSVLVGAFAVVAPLAVLVGWSVTGWTVPDRATAAGREAWVHRGDADVIPAVAVAEAEGPGATRTLILRVRTGSGSAAASRPQLVSWSLARAGGPRTGPASAVSETGSTAAAQDDQLLGVISGLLSDSGTDQRKALADRGIGSVLLLSPTVPTATSALDTAPGLVRVATLRGSVLWRVEMTGDGGPTRPARARLLDAGGNPLQTLGSSGNAASGQIAAGSEGRVLVLAERADKGWEARLDGRRLQPFTYDGWAQGFRVPAGPGGRLSVDYDEGRPAGAGPAWLVIAGLALLVALPMPRRRRRPAPRPAPVPAQQLAPPAGRRRRAPLPELDDELPRVTKRPVLRKVPPLVPPVAEVAEPEVEEVENEPAAVAEAEAAEPEAAEPEVAEPEVAEPEAADVVPEEVTDGDPAAVEEADEEADESDVEPEADQGSEAEIDPLLIDTVQMDRVEAEDDDESEDDDQKEQP